MRIFRTLVFVPLLVGACGRDDTRRDADSLPASQTVRPPVDTATSNPPDTTTPPPGDSMLTGSRITVERAVVAGILWGAPGEEVRRLLGQPQSEKSVWEEALGDSSKVLIYPDMSVRLSEDRVVGLHCTGSPSCITGDAVRIGATRAEVEQVYGKGQEERSGATTHLAYPFTTDDSCALRFELRQGKVGAIDVSCQMN